MKFKHQYKDETDKQVILDANKDKILIEEQRLFEGNFLIFSDIKPLEFQIKDLNNTTNMLLLKQEGVI